MPSDSQSGVSARALPVVRSVSLAEQVAAELRERIVSGELAAGSVLPKQEDLLVEFGVSKPSLREALRILETEGLVRVRRGKVGGAVVQRPPVNSTAHGIELALRSRGVSPDEVALAVRHLEPTCAGLCAARRDRKRAVVPRLKKAHEAAAAAVEDLHQYTVLSRQFHAEIVAACGNETIILVLSALEAICSEDSERWVEQVEQGGATRNDPILSLDYRREGIASHAELIELIAAGDAEGAERAARRHAFSRQQPSMGARRAKPS